MAKRAYIGVDNVARKIKKGYIGVDGVARKIKKAYIGIGGVARPCWSSGVLERYGNITPLSDTVYHLGAASVGNYALFAGGITYADGTKSQVDAYSKSLTRTSPSDGLSRARSHIVGGSVGNYALLAGGVFGNASSTTTVEAYDVNLTKTVPEALSYARKWHSSARAGNYLVIHGGANATVADGYDNSLSRYTIEVPSNYKKVEYCSSASIGNYALFGGGRVIGTSTNIVVAFDSSLTYSLPEGLLGARYLHFATSVNDYALFAGGEYYLGTSGSIYADDLISVYDESLTRTNSIKLKSARRSAEAVSMEGYALFAGGYGILSSGGYSEMTDVDAFDKSLTAVTVAPLAQCRVDAAATSVGDYALIGGGWVGSLREGTDSVEAYVVN